MSGRTIRIKGETYEQLMRLARPNEAPGAVLARLLGIAEPDNTGIRHPWVRHWGMLKPYLDAGDFQTGDELRYRRRRRMEELAAWVDARGRIRLLDGRVFTSPSAAGEAITGIPGSSRFESWLHVASGRTIAWWRDEHRRRAEAPRPAKQQRRSGDYLRDPFGTQPERDRRLKE